MPKSKEILTSTDSEASDSEPKPKKAKKAKKSKSKESPEKSTASTDGAKSKGTKGEDGEVMYPHVDTYYSMMTLILKCLTHILVAFPPEEYQCILIQRETPCKYPRVLREGRQDAARSQR
ncbi:hypothetical protein EB796_015530 [Bugula neritina]|uniref:Uncharacterized protein n=1 Tax=Bugula neritina TaxID=10212 RepID=A0A7J7JK44_BUGNE|nr:hypothetical protein EB796_015530 [Bugula neritina]